MNNNEEFVLLFHCNSCRRNNLPIEMFKLKRNGKYTNSCIICRRRKHKYYHLKKLKLLNAEVRYSSSNLQQ